MGVNIKYVNRDIYYKRKEILDFPVAPVVKNPPANAGDIRDAGLIPGSGRSPWRRGRQPTPVFLPG